MVNSRVSKQLIRFVRQGQWVGVELSDPNTTLLELVRGAAPAGLGCTGTKEGCASGDCGACMVLLGALTPKTGTITVRAVNACIRLASSIDGLALWTVEDLCDAKGCLHPAQQAMIEHHGAQCGFCTPGFVISLAALHTTNAAKATAEAHAATLAHRSCTGSRTSISREDVITAISGNLCRCTGYRPIITAAQAMAGQATTLDLQRAASCLAQAEKNRGSKLKLSRITQAHRPSSLQALLKLRAARPQAQVVAGTTDVGLWINKQHRRFVETIDITSVAALRTIVRRKDYWQVGAATPLSSVFEAWSAFWPQLASFLGRFAGLSIRNSATLGGNIANASPIGDMSPLLIALQARLRLASVRGTRELPIEDFFLDYRRTALADDEIICAVIVPSQHRLGLRAYKISKRYEDDISAVCLAVLIRVAPDQTISAARIGAGGVAAIPARARVTEQWLIGRPWSQATLIAAGTQLSDEFEPISDMRASAAYRKQILAALMLRFWHDEQTQTQPPRDEHRVKVPA